MKVGKQRLVFNLGGNAGNTTLVPSLGMGVFLIFYQIVLLDYSKVVTSAGRFLRAWPQPPREKHSAGSSDSCFSR